MFEDVCILQERLGNIECDFDGFSSVLKLKEYDYNWRQMEWWAFHFEYVVKKELHPTFLVKGVPFDIQRNINWDIKASVHTDLSGSVLLNDIDSTNSSVNSNQYHGNIIGFFDPTYDISGDFKKWHDELKGKKSKYVIERELRTKSSRMRKVEVKLRRLILVVYDENGLTQLDYVNQGLNSNRKPRKQKYSFNLLNLQNLTHYEIGVKNEVQISRASDS
jgi:hypothetical protein